jgi:sterol desaturase/sphingolipid hydroxylase (fatty acid hydroxylase superfamily)
MRDHDYIALAVPVFLGLILLERLADGAEGRSFDLGDSIANLGCGVLSQVAAVATAALVGPVVAASYLAAARLAPLDLGTTWVSWLVALLAVDFAYYWWHRAGHQVNALWAMHVVHHQSERYNLTVALRQPSFSGLIGWIVYVPIALLGVPLKVALAMTAFDTLYQFWIHTEKIGRLGPLELVLNTPSHHRVHHGVNPRYIDKNYGGILIVWDRLFGTFEAESERPVYGITKPLASLDPGWANLHYWFELARLSAAARGAREKLSVWLMYPGWRPAGVPAARTVETAPSPSPAAERLSLALLAAGIVLLSLLQHARGPWPRSAVLAALVCALILAAGRTLDRRPTLAPVREDRDLQESNRPLANV